VNPNNTPIVDCSRQNGAPYSSGSTDVISPSRSTRTFSPFINVTEFMVSETSTLLVFEGIINIKRQESIRPMGNAIASHARQRFVSFKRVWTCVPWRFVSFKRSKGMRLESVKSLSKPKHCTCELSISCAKGCSPI
jgi:hypothetical protein